jgi:flagellar capping protein FliD
MSTIQFGGVVSGLNTQSIVDALVAAQKQPLTDLQNKEADLTSQKAAYSQIGNAIDDLVAKIKSFTVTSAGAARTTTSTNSSILTATAGNSAAVGQYQILVGRLATASRATSTAALGSAVTAQVDTSATLTAANLATPITAGQMTLTVDGTTVQYTVGDPATTTLQSVMDGLASTLQAQLQATDPGAGVAATIDGNHLCLQITGTGTSHDISFGDPGDSSNLAAALGLDTQGVTGSLDTTITGTAYLDPTIASLNLPGSVTAGQISAVVDGQIVHYTVGDPATTTLSQMLDGFSAAIQAQLRAGGVNVGPDATATVSATVVNNKLQLSIGGAGAAHSLSFGAAGDASNALGILGIANVYVANAANPTLTGDTNLGVVRTTGILDAAGLTGLTSTKTGVLTINGVAINYDTTSDTLSSLITKINNSGAGVVASLDRTNDQLILTRKDTGALALDIDDTSGTLGAALKLAPGTINAQTVGQSAQVTIDGRTITSTTNAVTNAIDGVTINLTGQSQPGAYETLTVGVNASAVSSSLSAFITSFNSLGDLLDKLTATTPGQAGGTAGTSGPLASDPTAKTMFLQLRDTIFTAVGSGSINSLGAIGLNTGAIGSAVGTTNRLQLDTSALTAALNGDANQVASLLDGTSGPFASLLSQLTSYEDPSNTSSYVQAHSAGLTSEISELQREEADRQEMIDNYQAMIEAQYAAMESTLALLQSQSSQLAATLGTTVSSSSGSGLSSSSSS